MRFQPYLLVAALPALAVASDTAAGDWQTRYQAKFHEYVLKYIGDPNHYDAEAAFAAKNGPMAMTVLSLDNWKRELYEPVLEQGGPQEWWVLVTGGKRACLDHCDRLEAAWNETATVLAGLEDSPRVGMVNCEQQPVLCSTLGARAGNLWSITMAPPPAPVEIFKKGFNLTSVTSEDILALHESKSKVGWAAVSGLFHPFDGLLAKNGLGEPAGYFFWLVGLLPQWLMMLAISVLTRTFMSRRMNPPAPRQPNQQNQQPPRPAPKK